MAGYSNRFAFLDAEGEGVSIPEPKVVAKVVEAPKPVEKAANKPARANSGRGPRTPRDRAPREQNADGSEVVREDRPRRVYREGHKAATGEHERRSHGAPGSERTDRRNGGGRFNWGKDGKEAQETVAVPSSGEEAKAVKEEVIVPEVVVIEKTEEELLEERQITMSTYHKQLEENRAKLTALAVAPRAAGEGENTEQWKNNVQLSKKEDTVIDGLFAGLKPKVFKVVAHKKVESKDVTKELLKVRYESTEPERENRGGDRRGPRRDGKQSRGPRAAPKPKVAEIKLADNEMFPSL